MQFKRTSSLAASAALTAIGLATLAAPAAHADEWACTYPAVCFFKNYERTGSFVDITSGWQTLTASKNATGAWNTRHDDGALLHFTNGRTQCLRPGDTQPNLRARDCKTFGVTPDHGRCIDDQQQRDRGRNRRAV